jgi:hypothetical protein
MSNLNNHAGHFIVTLDTIPAGSLTLQVFGVSESGSEYKIFETLPMVSAGVYRSVISPSQNCVPGIVCRDFLPATYFYRLVHTTADTLTYSADIELGEGG